MSEKKYLTVRERIEVEKLLSERDATIAELMRVLEFTKKFTLSCIVNFSKLGDEDESMKAGDTTATIQETLDSSPSDFLERVRKYQELEKAVILIHPHPSPNTKCLVCIALKALKEES